MTGRGEGVTVKRKTFLLKKRPPILAALHFSSCYYCFGPHLKVLRAYFRLYPQQSLWQALKTIQDVTWVGNMQVKGLTCCTRALVAPISLLAYQVSEGPWKTQQGFLYSSLTSDCCSGSFILSKILKTIRNRSCHQCFSKVWP